MLNKLEEILSLQNGTLLNIKGDQHAAAVSTPLMKRAQKLHEASEILFADATGNCDLQDHKVYFFV